MQIGDNLHEMSKPVFWKKNISVCSLLKILPRVLSIKGKAGIYHIDLKAILIEE